MCLTFSKRLKKNSYFFFALIILGSWIPRRTDNNSKRTPSLRPPDYSSLHDWAAHPWKKDFADSVASFITPRIVDSVVDVFFIHPTSYTENLYRAAWNASLDDETLNHKTDFGSIFNQASVFNQHARIFAPRYRQAHLKAFFFRENENCAPALDTAYSDVKRAFLFYMQHFNQGRPIIIASHSQGTLHAVKLLQEYFDGKALQKQLICAYLVGWPVKTDDFNYIPAGDSATQLGCYVTWRSYQYGYTDNFAQLVPGKIACINPISWRNDTIFTSASEHIGGTHKNLSEVYSGIVQARVNKELGILWVYAPKETIHKYGRIKNYHVGDYNLFYLDIRENAQKRIKRWMLTH